MNKKPHFKKIDAYKRKSNSVTKLHLNSCFDLKRIYHFTRRTNFTEESFLNAKFTVKYVINCITYD